MMEKFGVITESKKRELEQTVEKYWKRYKNSFHPNFLDGVEYVMKHLNVVESVDKHSSDDYERGITDTINWIYQNLALDEPIPEKMIKDELLNKKKVQPKTINELWNEYRFTNEWKSACQFTTFEKFLDDNKIPYVK